MYRQERFSRASGRLSYRLHAIAELVAVLVAGVGQRLVKADILAGTLAQLVHLGSACWGRQLVPVILLHNSLVSKSRPLPPRLRDMSVSHGVTKMLARGSTLCRAVPRA